MAIIVTSTTQTSISVSMTTGYPSSHYDEYAWYLNDVWQYPQTTTPNFTFSNLTPNTTYTIRGEAYYLGGDGGPAGWYGQGSTTATTDAPPQPSNPTGVSFTVQSGTRNATLSFTKGANSDYTEILRSWSSTDSTSGSSVSYTLPNWSTTYTVYLRGCNSNGCNANWSGPYTITTGSEPQVPPSTPSQVLLSSRIDAGFILTWGSSSNATGYELNYRISPSGSWSTTTTSSTSTTITGRPYGTTHDFRVRAYNQYGYSGYSNITSSTTAPRSPTISRSQSVPTTVIISIGGMTGNYTDFVVERLTESGSLIDTRITTGSSVSWTNLPIDQKYKFRAKSRLSVSGTTIESVNYSNVLDITIGGRPTDFVWEHSQTTLQAFQQGQEADYAIDHRDWNNLGVKINEFRVYRGLETVTFTTVSRNTLVSSALYMQYRSAIAPMVTAGNTPPIRNQGQELRASDINSLNYALQSIQ